MAAVVALWLPILLSSVIVFVVSSIIHMLSPWHKSDYPKLANQDQVMDALRPHRGRHLRRVRGGACAAGRRPVPIGLQVRWHHRVHRLRGRLVADVDLVPPRVEHDDQGDGGRCHLRRAHRRHVRLALAALGNGALLRIRQCELEELVGGAIATAGCDRVSEDMGSHRLNAAASAKSANPTSADRFHVMHAPLYRQKIVHSASSRWELYRYRGAVTMIVTSVPGGRSS